MKWSNGTGSNGVDKGHEENGGLSFVLIANKMAGVRN